MCTCCTTVKYMANNYEFQHNEIKDYTVIIDSCSFLHKGAIDFWETRKDWYRKNPTSRNKVIIPNSCLEETEIRYHREDTSQEDRQEIRRGKRAIENAVVEGEAIYTVTEDKLDSTFADHTIYFHIAELLMSENILLITQDGDLTKSLYNLVDHRVTPAIRFTHDLVVCKLDFDGALLEASYSFGDDDIKFSKIMFGWAGKRKAKRRLVFQSSPKKQIKPQKQASVSHFVNTPKKQTQQKLKTDTNILHLYPKVIGVTKDPVDPKETFRLMQNGTGITLGKRISGGAEGDIYPVEQFPEKVVKIYKPDKIDLKTYQKLRAMIAKRLHKEGICFPIDILTDKKKQFVGYMMPKADGKPLMLSAFASQQVWKLNKVNYNRINVINWCKDVLDKFEYLHQNDILMGDVNPNNILMNLQTQKFYFVDTDSFQVDDYLCPTYMEEYLAPELTPKTIHDKKRSLQAEYYAIAVFLFCMLIHGKRPYDQTDSDLSYHDQKVKGAFPYPNGDKSQGNAPGGPFRYMWSHLPTGFKKSFWNIFSNEGQNFKKRQRPSPREWIRDFNEYGKKLQPGGSMVEFDAMSLEVFPRRYKFASKDKSNYKPCIRCGELFQYTLLNKTQGYCLYCASKIMVHGYPTTCIDCGAKIKYSIADAYYKHKPKPGKRCPGCQERYEKRKKG